MPAMGDHQNLHPVPVPGLLVRLPSWPRVFFGNLRDLLLPRRLPRLELSSAPAPFWPDVFVKRGLPWLGFVESGACHFFGFMLLMAVVRFVALVPQAVPRPAFDHSQVIYYSALEYLPPLDTRNSDQALPKKADPVFSPQPIISVPREADNHSQTIVAPPNVKLKHDVALPNIVAWSDTKVPRLAVPAAPLTLAADITRIAPRMKDSVVSPPPDAAHFAHVREQPNLRTSVVDPPPDLSPSRATAFDAPQPAVVAPPPPVENAPARAVGELNIGHSPVIAPAPQLAVGEQRAVPGGRFPAAGVAPQVVPPPPAFSAAGSAGDGSPGRVIALSLHPAVGSPPPAGPPPGNRRGFFAATPEGHPGASGAPGSSSPGSTTAEAVAGAGGRGAANKSGGGPNGKEADGIPAGLYVGKAPAHAKTSPVGGDPAATKSATVNPNLAASIPPPRVGNGPARPMQPETATKLSEAERAIFGGRRFYSLTLNMPNLNSAGGSWIVRFAELGDAKHDANTPGGDLSQPSAIRKVDPGYPLRLMRENVGGTVILYAVIHADGTVGNVRVLQGVDERLDRFATQAVAQWRFQPAMKDGVPVDVEATFWIPFRPPKTGF
jgi:TonB family protein